MAVFVFVYRFVWDVGVVDCFQADVESNDQIVPKIFRFSLHPAFFSFEHRRVQVRPLIEFLC